MPDDPVLAGHLPEVLRIHHISDLHHGGQLRSAVDVKDTSAAGQRLGALAGAGSPLDSYLRHVEQAAADGQAPHLLIVTGDLVNRPDRDFGQRTLDWLAQLRPLLADHRDLGPGDPRIVLVGGNHDVSWDLSLEPDPEARHRWFAETFRDYPHPQLDEPDHARRRLYVRYPGVGLRVALLGSAESGGEAASAMHHPPSPVPTVEIAPYSGIVNAGQTKRMLAAAAVALVLHGHTHLSFLTAERLLGNGPKWTMRVAGAATLASAESNEQNGYNQVFLAREGGGHSVVVRPVRLDGGQWSAGQPVGFRPGAADESELTDLLADQPVP